MANNEAAFRTELHRSFSQSGAFSKTIAHKMIAGVPDVFVCHPDWGSWWLELKFLRDGNQVLNLTALQRSFLDKVNTHGGCAGWVCARKVGFVTWELWAGVNHTDSKIGDGHLIEVKGRGLWNTEKMMDMLWAAKAPIPF